MNVNPPAHAKLGSRIGVRSSAKSVVAKSATEEQTAIRRGNKGRVAVAYGRRSFGDLGRATSPTSKQQADAKRCAEQHGFELIAFFAYHGSTGARMYRAGLSAMLEEVQSGRIDVVNVADIDRLSRDDEHLHYLTELFLAQGVTVHTIVFEPLASRTNLPAFVLAGSRHAPTDCGKPEPCDNDAGAAQPVIEQ
jgi:hypothetical protein